MEKTSLKAFTHMIESGKRQTHAEIILECLKSGFKGTYIEIAGKCGLTPSQVEKRLSEIKEIKPTGALRTTHGSCKGQVWGYIEGNMAA